MATEFVRLVPHYTPGYVVLAYVVAVLGAWSSIELLLRRTGVTGAFNALLLCAAGIAFGSTATWGMHFVSREEKNLFYYQHEAHLCVDRQPVAAVHRSARPIQ